MPSPDAGRVVGSNLPHADFLANFVVPSHQPRVRDGRLFVGLISGRQTANSCETLFSLSDTTALQATWGGVPQQLGVKVLKMERSIDSELLFTIGSLSISRYAQVRVAGHDIALKRSRITRIMAGSDLGPAEMKHRAYILQVQSEMSVLRMPVEIDDALANTHMFNTQRLV